MARISESRMVQMRRQREDSLQDTCAIRATVTTTDDETNDLRTWPAVTYTNVPCTITRKDTVPGGESLELSSDDQWFVIFVDTVTIAVPDHIDVLTGRHAGVSLEAYHLSHAGSYDFTTRVRCTENPS